MLAAKVLIFGVLLVAIASGALLTLSGSARILTTLLPLAPLVTCIGATLLIIPDLLLLFGNRADRKSALTDIKYLLATAIISGAIFFATQNSLWPK